MFSLLIEGQSDLLKLNSKTKIGVSFFCLSYVLLFTLEYKIVEFIVKKDIYTNMC